MGSTKESNGITLYIFQKENMFFNPNWELLNLNQKEKGIVALLKVYAIKQVDNF